eukprot:68223-Pleurochrysis_carterae.AAC.1
MGILLDGLGEQDERCHREKASSIASSLLALFLFSVCTPFRASASVYTTPMPPCVQHVSAALASVCRAWRARVCRRGRNLPATCFSTASMSAFTPLNGGARPAHTRIQTPS